MGHHECEYCKLMGQPPERSSEDITVGFKFSRRIYQMPAMVIHYVETHGWQPPEDFVSAVMKDKAVLPRDILKNNPLGLSVKKLKVGYLEGPFPKGDVPQEFLARLQQAMAEGDWVSTRG